MGGHGGLNILPQKSWNVYNRDNRQRVERDEARVAAEAAAAARQEHGERAAAGLETLRARAGTAPAAPLEHVNFFVAEERAQGNIEHQKEQKALEARLVARVMPDLQFDRSAKEPVPWYLKASSLRASEPPANEQEAMPPLSFGGVSTADDDEVSRKRHKGHKRHKDKEHKRPKHERQKHRDGRHKRSAAAGEDNGDDANAAGIQRLRQERLDRERHEQARARSMIAYGGVNGDHVVHGPSGIVGADARRQQSLVDDFLAKTGQTVTLAPRGSIHGGTSRRRE